MKINRLFFFEAPAEGGGGSGEGATLLSGAPAGEGNPPASSTPPAAWTGEDGSFVEGWADRLGEDLKDAIPTASRYKSVPEMVKALHHANQALGKKGVIIPTEKSTPEEVAAFRQALGVPESPDGYKLKPESLPEGMTWNDDLAKPFAEIAHKHNIPPAAMAEMVKIHMEQQASTLAIAGQMVEQNLEKGMEALKDAWKADTDKNLAFVSRVAKTVGLDPASPGLADPNVVIALERLGRQFSEDKLIRSDSAGTMQPGKVRAHEVMTNPADPLHADYMGKNGPERQQAAAKLVADLLTNG